MSRRTRSSSSSFTFESPKRLLRSQNHEAFLELPSRQQIRLSKRRQTFSEAEESPPSHDSKRRASSADRKTIDGKGKKNTDIAETEDTKTMKEALNNVVKTRRSSRLSNANDNKIPTTSNVKTCDSETENRKVDPEFNDDEYNKIVEQNKNDIKTENVTNDTGNEKTKDVPEIKEILENVPSYTAEYRTRNLRSSGIKCDPDFYSLALDLEIKRPRQPKSNAPQDETVSDSDKNETDENCLAENEEEQLECENMPEKSIEDAQNDEEEKMVIEKPKIFKVKPSTPVPKTPGRKPLVEDNAPIPPDIKMIPENPNSPTPLFQEDAEVESDVYCFESDHVALRQNLDYQRLLQTVAVLEAQRKQALDDIQILEKERGKALKNPLEFVQKLQAGVDLDLPVPQKIAELPKIDWTKYTSAYGTFSKVFSNAQNKRKPTTRGKQINFSKGVPELGRKANNEPKEKSKTSDRSETFKKFWTVEEQRHLEELLRKYPAEANEFNRCRKIAAEMKNRTALQVQSRVQKYFIKLAKAGLPIPGRVPSLERFLSMKNKMKKTKRHKDTQLLRMSTFFTKFHVPVRMQDNQESEEEDDQGWTTNQEEEVSDEEDIPPEMRFSDEYLEILRLKKLRKEKLGVFQSNGKQALAQHTGFECDMCQCSPIKGIRYHCIDCEGEDAVDLCQSCIKWKGKFETSTHRANHRMEPVYKAEATYMDSDYTNFASRTGEYNYLDPNYAAPSMFS